MKLLLMLRSLLGVTPANQSEQDDEDLVDQLEALRVFIELDLFDVSSKNVHSSGFMVSKWDILRKLLDNYAPV